MNYSSVSRSSSVITRLWRLSTSLFVVIATLAISAKAQSSGTGTLSGTVTSGSTHNALQGASVSISGLNRVELTDNAGHYSFSGVPAGVVDVSVSYSGFNQSTQKVTVDAGKPAQADIELKSSEVLTMQAFTVETMKEGQALSLTEQKNSINIKNVTAFDEWGILPTQNVGELASRLPGITFTTDEDNLINNISIAGQPASYTRLNIDGMSTTGVGGDGRTATLHSFSGSNYEAIEIIKGQTPDKRADSLGGQVNLRTKSPLALSERRRINYSAATRFFPGWSDRNIAVSERGPRPDLSVSYTEVFDVAGGHRNLGIVIGAAYQEVLNPHDNDTLLYEANTGVAQLRDYTRQSGLNDRFLSAFSARADYRIARSTTVSLRFLYNAGSEPFFHYTAVNPFVSTNLTVNSATNPTGAIAPGYTDNHIEILPVLNTTLQPGNVAVGAAQMRLFPQRYSFTSKNPTGTLVFDHDFGNLKVDHSYRWSNTHWDSGAGRQREDGTVALRTKGAFGFTLDRGDPLHGKSFTWTGGVNPYDISSYTPFVITAANTTTQPVPITSASFNKRDTVTDTNEVAGQVNASYNLSIQDVPIIVKAGLDTTNRRVNNRNVYPRRWYQNVGTVLPANGLMPLTEFERQNGGQRLPVVDPAAISKTLGDASLWYEDVNFTATQQYTNRRIMEEGVDAAYIQSTFKFGRFTALAGVRGEWVSTEVFSYFRARTTPIAVEPDNFKRAAMDYSRLSVDGGYHKFFPSLHMTYNITANLKASASWSNSYGRPLLAQMVAGATAADPTPAIPTGTLTIGNPALKPQTADNINGQLDYYFLRNTGVISVSAYQKNIRDYIGSNTRSGTFVGTGPDNGFDGLYGGYEIIEASNLGDALLKGFEFDFRQRMTFLPGVLKGLTLRGNYTRLQATGKFGGIL